VKIMARKEKTERELELEDAIVRAVADLDESDGSRVGTSEAIDSAREILSDAYGVGFEDAVSECLSEVSDEDEDDGDEDEDEDE
jgi:hypothetical protein